MNLVIAILALILIVVTLEIVIIKKCKKSGKIRTVQDADIPGQVNKFAEMVVNNIYEYKVVSAVPKDTVTSQVAGMAKNAALGALTGWVKLEGAYESFLIVFGKEEMKFIPYSIGNFNKKVEADIMNVQHIKASDLQNVKCYSKGKKVKITFKNGESFLFGSQNTYMLGKPTEKEALRDFDEFIMKFADIVNNKTSLDYIK